MCKSVHTRSRQEWLCSMLIFPLCPPISLAVPSITKQTVATLWQLFAIVLHSLQKPEKQSESVGQTLSCFYVQKARSAKQQPTEAKGSVPFEAQHFPRSRPCAICLRPFNADAPIRPCDQQCSCVFQQLICQTQGASQCSSTQPCAEQQ